MKPSPTPTFPAAALEEAMHWASFFGGEWSHEFPEAVEASWPADFAKLLAADDSRPVESSARARTSRVMRRLRRVSPRAYEVLLRTMIHGESLDDTTRWLNDRAKLHDIPLPAGQDVNYTLKDTVALFLAGVDFARTYF